ncbi:MAG: inositol monophosphatase family protein [Candidatus Micrarchaeota archaeon]
MMEKEDARDKEIDRFILDLLVRSGRLLAGKQERAAVSNKGAHDLVTDADLASEKLIVSAIRERYPSHAVYSEEGERSRDDLFARDCWVIDPLDGTNNYAYGFPIWGVSIAYARNGEVVAGGVGYPMQGIYFTAHKERGAYRREENPKSGKLGRAQRISVSSRADLSKAMVLVCMHLSSEQGEAHLAGVGRIAKRVFNVRNLGAAVFNLGYVANGLADACVEFKLQPYDGAAGALLVNEAGGRVSRLDGGKWRLDSPDMVCSNGKIHDELIKALDWKN